MPRNRIETSQIVRNKVSVKRQAMRRAKRPVPSRLEGKARDLSGIRCVISEVRRHLESMGIKEASEPLEIAEFAVLHEILAIQLSAR